MEAPRVVQLRRGIALPRPVEVKPPQGYEVAWDDGRLNPNRGPQTLRGDLQQAQVWTDEIPARDVNAPAQKNTWATIFEPKVTRTIIVSPASSAGDTARVSSKSTAPATTPAPAQDGLRYVQVGAFGDPANASRSISRLSGLGLPVSSQTVTRGGKTIKVVLAGPFSSAQQTMNALGSVKAAGYSDAFARK